MPVGDYCLSGETCRSWMHARLEDIVAHADYLQNKAWPKTSMLPSLKNPTAVARAALSASQTLHAQALKNSVRYFATGIGAQDGM